MLPAPAGSARTIAMGRIKSIANRLAQAEKRR
jgi:hypothetical protein